MVLENKLGWSGVTINAQESYRTGYEQHRPRTKFFALFALDDSTDTSKLFLGAAQAEVRQQILDYFTANRYTVVGKYLKVDPENI